MWLSLLFPNVELLKISLRQFIACTCGRRVSSLSDSNTGCRATAFNSDITPSNARDVEFADKIPVINAGIPADRRVVDACFLIQANVP
jgi:hypothetical protein